MIRDANLGVGDISRPFVLHKLVQVTISGFFSLLRVFMCCDDTDCPDRVAVSVLSYS